MKKIIELSVLSIDSTSKIYALKSQEYTIGSGNTDIVLSYPTVSKLHGKFIINDNEVSYVDLDSKNGSYFKSELNEFFKIEANQRMNVTENKRIKVGPFELSWTFRIKDFDVSGVTGNQNTINENARKFSSYYLSKIADGSANPLEALKKIIQFENLSDQEKVIERIYLEHHKNGPIEVELSNPECREVLINGYDDIYLDIGKGLRKTNQYFFTEESYLSWITRTAHLCGRRIDLQHPICEATLPNGSRFHAVLNPISGREAAVAIRKFGAAPIDEVTALETGWLNKENLKLLKDAVCTKKNIVISGGTSTGKTSLLNFLCQYFAPSERIITIEDTLELKPPVKNLVQLQARRANAEGAGEITLQKLIQCSLRMRPDRIIVGECRGPEVFEMIQALNTGHPGSLTTVHANSCVEAMSRLELLALMGSSNLNLTAIQSWLRSTIDIIVQVERNQEGKRFISNVYTINNKANC